MAMISRHSAQSGIALFEAELAMTSPNKRMQAELVRFGQKLGEHRVKDQLSYVVHNLCNNSDLISKVYNLMLSSVFADSDTEQSRESLLEIIYKLIFVIQSCRGNLHKDDILNY